MVDATIVFLSFPAVVIEKVIAASVIRNAKEMLRCKERGRGCRGWHSGRVIWLIEGEATPLRRLKDVALS